MAWEGVFVFIVAYSVHAFEVIAIMAKVDRRSLSTLVGWTGPER
jgi:hypothetical protein